jgi:hypothetical protein
MAHKRKTTDVATALQAANKLLASPNFGPDFRKGVASMLETILWATGQYHGYNFLGWAVEGGCERWRADGCPKDNSSYIGDETRRVYYGPREAVPMRAGGAKVDEHFPLALS